MRRIAVLSAVTGAVTLALAGCTPADDGGSPPDASSSVKPLPAVTAGAAGAEVPDPGTSVVAAEPATSYIARAKSTTVDVLTEPGGESQVTVSADDVLTVPDLTPLVFLVDRIEGSWVEVYLPVRPNGSTGWVAADDVVLSATDFSVDISLSDFTLTVWDGDTAVLEAEIGLGTEELPTPGGTYYVRELLQPPDPGGAYGPYAYGLSGYSPVLDEFAGGEAIIGIHGTNDPTSFGRAVSHGCIRLPNDVITELVEEIGIPLGTPVRIEE
ncbi:L,D-transpeptidase [Demequina mangrovi]|uniref:L,D-transpeptidase catalytic domain n=1 Tax=Demequina mangrovi TaxID=1043493 RepID=A0A1H6YJ48_9MICO|nr:L,D-transpeptidase family protein [Demequina mangrovi]SEJ41343.1 L,D-transpeptidase catalytic domain [Demequina mangrovi]